jgi:two-component sensor histidine kinase
MTNGLVSPAVTHNLALAILTSSAASALLLDEGLTVISASDSFYHAFALEPKAVKGHKLFDIGAGEWDVPQLRSLLAATLSGHTRIEAYEMDLKGRAAPCRLVLNAQRLDYGEDEAIRMLLTITDVTEARISAKLQEDLLHEKSMLLQELQHRVANSLQIIASVLMQSARRVQSDEARGHLHDAHHRVMSIASLQRQLAESPFGEVGLSDYFTSLCESLGASMIFDHSKVSITLTADETRVSADVSVSLGLIVTELVINSLKHAFPGTREGKILVDYHSEKADWTLTVADDGVGTTQSLADAKPGLGSGIVEALAGQLEATVVSAGAEPGVIVTVTHTDPASEVGPAKEAV